jgi:hypothetical protein
VGRFRPDPPGVTPDYAEAVNVSRQHHAFLVSEMEFDATLARMRTRASSSMPT